MSSHWNQLQRDNERTINGLQERVRELEQKLEGAMKRVGKVEQRASVAQSQARRYFCALAQIRDSKARNIIPWTHEAAADEFSRVLSVHREIARLALMPEPEPKWEPESEEEMF